MELEMEFQVEQYLSHREAVALADRVGLTETQVRTWFQNRRTKMKKRAVKRLKKS